MKFTDVFIQRPVLAAVLSILLMLVGIVSYQRLSVRQFPKTQVYVISISTSYTGASAEEMESYITRPIENAAASIDNVDYIESQSKTGSSLVSVHLKLNANIDAGILDLQTKVSSAASGFPAAVDKPVIEKQDPDASPIMIISFSDNHRSAESMTDYLIRDVVPQLSILDGVSSAQVLGERTYAMRIYLDTRKMAAHHISAADIQTALKKNNLEAQSGEIDRKFQIINVRANTALNTVEQFNYLIIKNINKSPIRIKDIGYAKLGAYDRSFSLYVNGKQTVGIGIFPRSDANPLSVAAAVKSVLAKMNDTLPAGMSTSIAKDASVYIEQSINEVERTITEACIFVILVIFLFTVSLRSALIPIVTIPLSLVSIAAFMMFMGYSINTLTLLAAVLSIGMIVDDAIVVLENIHRHIQEGMSPLKAAIMGAREIRFAIISMTLTLAVVYLPLMFTIGLTGSLFREFAFVLAGVIIISGFIALTLSPMMCSKIMLASSKKSLFEQLVDQSMSRLVKLYRLLLNKMIHAKFLMLTAMIGVIAAGCMVFVPLYFTSQLAPSEDAGMVVGIATAPTSSILHYTETYTRQLNHIFQKISEIDRYVTINGFGGSQNKALVFLSLTPWSTRKRTANQIINELNVKAANVPGVSTMFFNPPELPGSSGIYPVQFVIKSTGSYESLARAVDQLITAVRENHSILQVESDLYLNKPEVQINVDRNKANVLGISMEDVASTLNIALGTPSVSTFVMDGLNYYVIPQLASNDMNNPDKINDIYIMTSSGKLIPLSNVITIKNIVAPTQLNHFQGERSAVLSMSLKPNYSTAQAIHYLTASAKRVLPDNMSYDFSGTARLYQQEGHNMLQMFLLALLFIYLLLSAQFESFRYPLIVLMTVPLALTAALAALFFTHASLNIYTEIALVALIGLISKHGILIVEFARQLQQAGKNAQAAIIDAASIRLRPILMTTLAMVLGAIPLIFSSGAGANARIQIGVVIVSGMLLGTILTLFLVPTFYLMFAKKDTRILP
jgi:multidrug efflux pump